MDKTLAGSAGGKSVDLALANSGTGGPAILCSNPVRPYVKVFLHLLSGLPGWEPAFATSQACGASPLYEPRSSLSTSIPTHVFLPIRLSPQERWAKDTEKQEAPDGEDIPAVQCRALPRYAWVWAAASVRLGWLQCRE
jgi:hypothetical protein